ncbi:MAG: DNA repair protein RecN [Eubacterium sp.]|nr:DNA repair protein RecN [Eubacterium sp.]
MLETLHVKNLAVIDESEIEFGEGLNILTGETGAGKSVILGSANLALGAKASKDLIRSGKECALVEMVFWVKDDILKKKLEDIDIETEDERVILSRKITEQKSICRINSETVTASRLKQAAEVLIDIHGQHEHQKLLKSSNHLKLLDDFAAGKLKSFLEDYKGKYAAYKNVLKELSESDLDDEGRKREISFTEFEINEIESANLKEGEDEELEEYFKKASNAKNINDALLTANNLIGDGGASDMLSRAVREIGSVLKYDDALGDIYEAALSLEQLSADASKTLGDYIENNVFDEKELADTEMRLNDINHLKSKYGKTITEVLSYLAEKKEYLKDLENYEEKKYELKKKSEDYFKECMSLAEKISSVREEAAGALSEQVTKALKELNFTDAKFEINVIREEGLGENGINKAEIMLSANPGEPLKPIEKTASGGELSRIMLALKSVGAQKDEIGTLIFDEIDTGISGQTAQKVGQKLEELAKDHQIICITHLPQIASKADRHFMISKKVSEGKAVSGVEVLGFEDSVKELARMMGGEEITEALLKSAEEMKKG